jgi:hypothetical protein
VASSGRLDGPNRLGFGPTTSESFSLPRISTWVPTASPSHLSRPISLETQEVPSDSSPFIAVSCSSHRSTATSQSAYFRFFSNFFVPSPALIRFSSNYWSMDYTPLGLCYSRRFFVTSTHTFPGLLLPFFVIFGAFGLHVTQTFTDSNSVH